MKLLVCGGAGFIGSTFVRQRLLEHGDEVTVLDKLTYAGREENFHDIASEPGFRFVHGAIEDDEAVAAAIEAGGPEAIVNFAAETHVDRSIAEPDAFVRTHALGTYVLLEAARERELRYVQVSTDEVYGSIEVGTFTEESPAAALLALLGHEDGRGPAGAELLPHLRPAGDDRARLEQLRPLPVPGEADPADGPQRAARRRAAGLRRRDAGAQLDPRERLRARDRARARAWRAGRGLQRGRSGRAGEHRGRQADRRARRAPRSRRSSTSAIARATTGATRCPRRRCARWAGRRGCASRTAWRRRSRGIARTPGGGSRSARATTAPTTSASTAARSADQSHSRDGLVGYRQVRDPPLAAFLDEVTV